MNWIFDSSAYLINVSEITRARNTYKKTLVDLNVKLSWTLENVNRKQLNKANNGI